jgi:uncharacterized protein (TIGR00162 family)
MVTTLSVYERPRLRNPILIEGLPGIGNVGKVVVEYLIEMLEAKRFAELHSSHFPYHVFVADDDTVELPTNSFYYWKRRRRGQRDIIILTGDIQSITPEGHYEVVSTILDLCEEFKVKDLITIGGFGVQKIPEVPKVIGAVTDVKLKDKLKGSDVIFSGGSRVGFIVGASGLLLGLGKLRGFEGVCFMGETVGTQPFFTDSKAARSVLAVINGELRLDLDMSKIEQMSGEMERAIGKAKEIQSRILEEMAKASPPDEFRYIG